MQFWTRARDPEDGRVSVLEPHVKTPAAATAVARLKKLFGDVRLRSVPEDERGVPGTPTSARLLGVRTSPGFLGVSTHQSQTRLLTRTLVIWVWLHGSI